MVAELLVATSGSGVFSSQPEPSSWRNPKSRDLAVAAGEDPASAMAF